MTRDEAIELLKGGKEGIAKWSYQRQTGKGIESLKGADLSGADLRGAELGDVYNKLDGDFYLVSNSPDLNGANLRGADLRRADLGAARLQHADLSKARLAQAFVVHADLTDASLRHAQLYKADLRGANLGGADLTCAYLEMTLLSDTCLNGAELAGAELDSAFFGGMTDLSVARGLESVKLRGPCELGVKTLLASKGRIPESFLRGCGLQPWEIVAARMHDTDLTALQLADIQAESFRLRTEGPLFIGGVFISYQHDDAKFAEKVYKKLQEAGASVWLDKHDAVAGEVRRVLTDAIGVSNAVVFILSESSIKSRWVHYELTRILNKEIEESRSVVAPVALDNTWKSKTDYPWEEVREKVVLDFSQWEDDEAFDREFQKLLKGLKIYYKPAGDKTADGSA